MCFSICPPPVMLTLSFPPTNLTRGDIPHKRYALVATRKVRRQQSLLLGRNATVISPTPSGDREVLHMRFAAIVDILRLVTKSAGAPPSPPFEEESVESAGGGGLGGPSLLCQRRTGAVPAPTTCSQSPPLPARRCRVEVWMIRRPAVDAVHFGPNIILSPWTDFHTALRPGVPPMRRHGPR